MPGRYSMSPEGENFQLPVPGDYAKEFDRLRRVVKKQRDLGREIVVSEVKGLARGHIKRIKDQVRDEKEQVLLQMGSTKRQ